MTNIDRDPNIYSDHYTAADIIADVIWTDEGTLRGTVTEAAQALKDSGRLMPDLQIISTVPELEALDPDTMLMHRAYRALIHPVVADETDLPLSVVATGEQVRAALKALEEA